MISRIIVPLTIVIRADISEFFNSSDFSGQLANWILTVVSG